MSEEVDFDSLFDDFDEFDQIPTEGDDQFLFIGKKSTYDKLFTAIKEFGNYNIVFSDTTEGAINNLLQNVFALVFIENDLLEFNTVTVSRIVRVNHPLARILILSKSKKSSFISDIINNGSADGFIYIPLDMTILYNTITEQLARHDINRSIITYVKNPPKLSKQSYLLLDPSLSFGDENQEVKFVGFMIAYESVPRYSYFFEQLLNRDEILFSGYISGISILGQELFKDKEPLKEINFGGISVILKFIDSFQFLIFVRNLTVYNAERTEIIIDEVVNTILNSFGKDLENPGFGGMRKGPLITELLEVLVEHNEEIVQDSPEKIEFRTQKVIALLDSDRKRRKMVKHLSSKRYNLNIEGSTSSKEVKELLEGGTYQVLIIDSKLKGEDTPLNFADLAKNICPYLHIIYLVRDRRTSSTLIDALNRGVINFLLPYRISYKRLIKWIYKGIERAEAVCNQSGTAGIDSKLHQATIAKMMIRDSIDSFISESAPNLVSFFITKNVELVFFYTNEEESEVDQEMLGGIIATIDSVGSETFDSEDELGKVNIGGFDIFVQHREEYNFGYLIDNLDPNTSVLISKDISKFSDDFYKIIENEPDLSSKVKEDLKNKSEEIFEEFFDKYNEAEI
jgi:DNA-binding NarL/FixJ family response regulator